MEMASPDLEKQGFFAVVLLIGNIMDSPTSLLEKVVLKNKSCATRSCPNHIIKI